MSQSVSSVRGHGYVQLPSGAWVPQSATAVGTKNATDVNIVASQGGNANVTGTLTGSGSSVAAAVGQMGNGTIQVSGGTFTNLTIAFEASVDGGTTYFPIDVVRTDGQQVPTQLSFVSQAVLPIAFNYMAPGYTHVRVRQVIAATTQTANPTVTITQGPFLYDPSPTVVPIDGNKWTFSSTINGTNVAAAVTANVPLYELVNAGTTKIIRLTRVAWELTAATAASSPLIVFSKRTAASTGGTAVLQSIVTHDTSAPGPVATSKYYTAIPTVAEIGRAHV